MSIHFVIILTLKPRWHVHLRYLGLYLSISLSSSVYAEVHRFDQTAPATVPSPLFRDAPVEADAATETAVQDKALLQLSDKELHQYPRVMAHVIEQAIKQRQWGVLRAVLTLYVDHPDADPYLVLYAQGTLHRQDKRYYLAIGAFQALLHLRPELSYIRLDLAMMQMEDKQYAEAIETFTQLQNDPNTPAQFKHMTQQYLKQLRKLYDTDVTLSGSFTRNDNVNQASAERTLDLWGMQFIKHPDNLPKTGHGLNYGMGLRKLLPLQGNHGLSLALLHNGTYYWDQKDYSERSLRFSPAYLYQAHDQWLKAGPVYEQNWLGDRKYGSRLGMQAEWGKQIAPLHYLIPYADYTHKRYESTNLNRYKGDTYKAGMTWFYQPKRGNTLSTGAHYQQDALEDKAESSRTIAVRLGGSFRSTGGMNTQANIHLGTRDFDAVSPLFGYTRRDEELLGSISIWHSKVSIMGITPKLVYRYSRIDSNISALYSRTSRGFMLEIVDRSF